MSGEKDSTRQTAPGGIAEAAGLESTPQARGSAVPQAHNSDARGSDLMRSSDLRSSGLRSSDIMNEISEQTSDPIRNTGAKGGGKAGQRPAGGSRPPRMLDRAQQERIGAALRESFADIEKEPIPERLSKLIDALHQEEKRR
jgi:hypothetical protein